MPYNHNPNLQRDLSETTELVNKIKNFQSGLSGKQYELYQELFVNINRFISFVIPNFEKKLKDATENMSDDDFDDEKMTEDSNEPIDTNYDSVSEYEEDDPDIDIVEIPEQHEYLRNKYTEEQFEQLKDKNIQAKYINNLFSYIEKQIKERKQELNYSLEHIFE